MLDLVIPGRELYDPNTEEFIQTKAKTLKLEHSLIAVSKWESKWNKPFLSREAKTFEESLDYIKYMTITQNVDDNTYLGLTRELIAEVNNYIDSPMSATTFSDTKSYRNREVITSEVIYYQMIAFNIPFECQKWHLNRLTNLIKICSIKNSPPKKVSKKQILSRNAELNAKRKQELGTRG